jgi:hypothetical protein
MPPSRAHAVSTIVVVFLLLALLDAACGSSNTKSGGANQPSAALSSASVAPVASPAGVAPVASPAGAAPVEFTFLGLTDDKAQIHYTIKVDTDKPIDEVHLHVVYTNTSGKTLYDGTDIWQNIVKSTGQPIESGHTYDALDSVDAGTAKADVKLEQVVYKDLTFWNAPK